MIWLNSTTHARTCVHTHTHIIHTHFWYALSSIHLRILFLGSGMLGKMIWFQLKQSSPNAMQHFTLATCLLVCSFPLSIVLPNSTLQRWLFWPVSFWPWRPFFFPTSSAAWVFTASAALHIWVGFSRYSLPHTTASLIMQCLQCQIILPLI